MNEELKKYQEIIKRWRRNKKQPRERMPEELKQEILKLTEKYPLSILIRVLGLHYDFFNGKKKRDKKKNIKSIKKQLENKFIEIKPMVSIETGIKPILVYETSSGNRLSIYR